MGGAAQQILIRHRPRDPAKPVERLDLLWLAERAGPVMIKQRSAAMAQASWAHSGLARRRVTWTNYFLAKARCTMDGFFVILGLATFIGFLLGPIAFFLTIGARRRLRDAEEHVARLEARLKRIESTGHPTPSATSAPSASETPVVAPKPIEQPEAAPAARSDDALISGQMQQTEPAPPLLAQQRAPQRPRRSFEEAIGTRWTVWVGGIALALGALLLVRYSFEQGYFGPGARVLLGLALAVALVAGGEWMRRKERASGEPQNDASGSAYIPGVLTACGAVAAFGAFYAAYAIYGFVGPALALIALGATGVACMLAAALHGPALAGLGLIGSLATPLLVSSDEPNPWALMIYLAAVSLASYGFARLRRWKWLAISTAIGVGLWSFAYIIALSGGTPTGFFQAGAMHVLVATALAAWFISVQPWLDSALGSDSVKPPQDPASVIAPASFAIVMLALLFEGASFGEFGVGWIFTAAAMMIILAIAGLASSTATALLAVCGTFIVATLRIWPSVFASDFVRGLPDWSLVHWVEPVNVSAYVALAIIASFSLGALAANPLLCRRLSFVNACMSAGTATLTPLLALIVAYLRFGKFDTSYTFAAIAAALGVVFVSGAQVFRTRVGDVTAVDRPPEATLGLGAFASATIAALALALTFALAGGTLTIALALAALGAAYVSAQLQIPALRWCVAALGAVVAARLAWEPRIVGDTLGKTPLFNWLLVGYGVPALAFGYAARIMRRADESEDTPVRVAQTLAILLAAFLVMFEIRHALHDGDIYATSTGFVEQGLFVFSGFAFSAALTRITSLQKSTVFRIASYTAFIGSVAVAILGLGLGVNPLFQSEPIRGGGIINTLSLGYLLPAIAAFVTARLAVGVRPNWYPASARIVAIALVFALLTLETRFLFQGPDIYFLRSTSQAEWYTYSAVWLSFGLVLLAYGLWRGSKEARLASALFVFLTVVKVFLFDLEGLMGLWRALSFIGLGLVLLGIGFVYQKFVFVLPQSPAPDGDARDARRTDAP